MMTVSKGNTGFLAVLETPVTGASQELWVQLTVGSQLVNFLATYSVLNCKLASLSKTTIPILGVPGRSQHQSLFNARGFKWQPP